MKIILIVALTVILSGVSFFASAQTVREEKIDESIVEIYLTDATPPKISGVVAGVPVTFNTTSEALVDTEKKEVEEVLTNEVEVRFFKNGQPSIKGYFEKSINDNWATYLSVFQTRGWTEFTAGPVYYITPEMSVGIGVGTSRYMAADEETKSSHTTISAFWYLKSENWEAEVLAERYKHDSVNPNFLEAFVQKKVTDNLSVGLFAQNDMGWGPRLSYSFSKNISIWASPIVKKYGESITTAIIGIKISF